jgi:hypothetical protein
MFILMFSVQGACSGHLISLDIVAIIKNANCKAHKYVSLF